MSNARKYLFLDRGIVDGHRCENAQLRLCAAKKDPKAPFFTEEFFSNPPRPWEVRYDNGYPQVIRDQETGAFRLYYTTSIHDEDSARATLAERRNRHYKPSPERITATCYATSDDGVRWTKPDLNIVEFEGSSANNILLKNAHGASVLFDPADPNPSRRYKLIAKMEYSRENAWMGVAFSPDGVEFGPPRPWPAYNPRADTHNFVFKDPATSHFVLITRLWKDGMRIVAKSESSDFMTWSEPKEIARGPGFENQIYSMPVVPYAGLYFGLASIYHEGDRHASDFDTVDLTLMYSSDLEHFNWIEEGASLIARGSGSYPDGEWDCGCIYASPFVEMEGKMCVYYMGGNGRHTDFRETGLGRAWLEQDAFACYAAKDRTNEAVLTLRPAHFFGDRLRILADIEEGGWIRCDLLNRSQTSAQLRTSGWSDVTFRDVSLSRLGNMPCTLRFVMRGARMYAMEGDLSIMKSN